MSSHHAHHPNEIWQADHTLLPIRLRGPEDAVIQPWLTLIEDDYSRAIAGYRLSLEAPTALHTALVFRDAIWRKGDPRWQVCGIPEIFYTDHGSDFTFRHLEQVAADLKTPLVFSTPGVPRGRGKIERRFCTIEQRLLSMLPGYAPPGNTRVAPVLTLSAFEMHLRSWLLDQYHQETHRETGRAPVAHWAIGGFLPQLPERLEQLDLLLLTVPRTRRVQQDGIHVHGLRYLSTTLAAYVREEVVIRYDRSGIGLILIGMPGLERRMARYPQLYSRVGFVHQYRPLSGDELRFILAHKWEQLGLTLDPSDYTDAEALAAITSITGGNCRFRLIQRLFTQIERILAINGLRTISGEVVMAARQTLVIGEA